MEQPPPLPSSSPEEEPEKNPEVPPPLPRERLPGEPPPLPPPLPEEKIPPPLPSMETPQLLGEAALNQTKWERLTNDPRMAKGLEALIRTLANTGLSVADLFPGVGKVSSWGVDALKFAPYLKKLGLERLDPTPTISRKAALFLKVLKYATFGRAPIRAIETFLQLKREDWANMREAAVALREILKADKEDYEEHREEIDEAIKTFKPKE